MDMEHRVWSGVIQTLEKQPLGICAYIILYYHFTRYWKARKTRLEVELQILLVECKVAGLIPERMVFAFHIFKLAIIIVQCNVPILMPVVHKNAYPCILRQSKLNAHGLSKK